MKNNITALYVEDNEEIQQEIVEILEDYFFKVLTADNGLTALKVFEESDIDILITDISMPMMNGIELIKIIKKEKPNIPIILLTAHDEYQYLIESIKLKVDGYILKPIDIFELDTELNLRIEDLQLRQKLKQKEKLLSEYKDLIDEGAIVSKTDINGKIIFANEAFSELSGYSIKELIGSDHSIIRHQDMPSSLYENMWDIILNKKVWRGKLKNKNKNGNYYWVDVLIKPILDENNEIIEFIALRKDITLEVEYKQSLEKKVNEQVEKLKQKDKVLQEQAKLAAMGEMIDAIAHQWKQPINIIKMKTEIIGYDLEDGKLDQNTMDDFQDKVFNQIEHILTTLDEFRTFLRPNKELKDFNVLNSIKSIETIMRDELMQYCINLTINTFDNLTLRGIENEFKHVVINLINNSKDAFNENDIEDRQIKINIYNNKIEVIDNAGGIPEHIIDKIFEANITSKDEGKGTGIGLYMTKQIVEKMGASIGVKNIEAGAMFTITLPMS